MGTSKHSNHSTTGSATPTTRYDNHSTVALGNQHAKEHAVCQQFLTRVFSLLTCRGQSLDLFESLSMTFTADGKRQRLTLILYSFPVILI